MNGNSPELQEAYDELTAAIEKVISITSPPEEGDCEALGEYVIAYAIDMIDSDGDHADGNGIMVRNGRIPLSNVAGLLHYATVRTDTRISRAGIEYDGD